MKGNSRSKSMSEEWISIPGYEGIYEASSLGRIRSAEGKTTSNARYQKRVWKSRILKYKHPVSKKRQDLRVTLWKDGTRKDYLVSRLIASAWLGAPHDGMTVDHLDGNYLNNRADNLEWVSRRENIRRGFDNGQYQTQIQVTLFSQDGSQKVFRSMSEASHFLGRNHGYISYLFSTGRSSAVDVSGNKYWYEIGNRLEA